MWRPIFNSAVLQDHYEALKASLDADKFSGYPKDYQRVDQKTLPVIENLHVFAGSHVLEIGSNFGMYSLLMSPIARQVTAVELDPTIYKASLKWRQFFERLGYSFDNVRTINGNVASSLSIEYDALLLTLVLYHLTNDEIDLLIEDARKKCERMVIQCRPGRMLAKERGSFVGYVSKTDRFDGLFDIASNIRFMRTVGMKKINVHVNPELLGDEAFPVLVGYR